MIARGYKVSSLKSTSSAPAQMSEAVEEDVEEAWVLPDDTMEHTDDVFHPDNVDMAEAEAEEEEEEEVQEVEEEVEIDEVEDDFSDCGGDD